MLITRLAGLLLAASLTACSTGAGTTSTSADAAAAAPATTPVAADDAAAACQARGGELRPLGRLQRVQCVVPYADAGKTCSTGQDCEGQCLAIGEVVAGAPAAGVCQRDASENFGCRQRIEGGVAQGTLCVD